MQKKTAAIQKASGKPQKERTVELPTADEKEKEKVKELIQNETHLFIEASAGSGKTTRLVSLIVEIIEQEKAKLPEILCVTFTEKAAAELKSRVYQRLKGSASSHAKAALQEFSQNAIGTIHSFCLLALRDLPNNFLESNDKNADDAILAQDALEEVIRLDWTKLPTDDLANFLAQVEYGKGGKDAIFEKEITTKSMHLFASPSTKLFPDIKKMQQVKTGDDFIAWTIYRTFERMRKACEQKNLLTFSTMITKTADALGDKEFVKEIQKKFKYALIDEFQDTDTVQWKIFSSLFLNKTHKLIVVGDPKQAIYKFRGADVFVYLDAKQEMRNYGALEDELPQNFRSTDKILTVLNSIFTNERVQGVWEKAGFTYTPPTIVHTSGMENPMEFYLHEKEKNTGFPTQDFAYLTASRIQELKKKNPTWSIGVIAFKHSSLEVFAKVFRETGIEFAYYNAKPKFSQIEFKHLKIFLQSFALPLEEGFRMAADTLFLRARSIIENEDTNTLYTYYSYLYQLANEKKIMSFLQRLAENHAVLHLLLKHDGDALTYHTWRVLFERLLNAVGESIYDIASLKNYLLQIENEDTERNGDMLRSPNAAMLLTVQSAKGLAWDIVVLADGHNNKQWKNFPFFHNKEGKPVIPANNDSFNLSPDKLLSIEDESKITQLNNLYVALTRAKNYFIGYITPSQTENSKGPIAEFLYPLRDTINTLSLKDALENLPTFTLVKQKVLKEKIDHKDIDKRISKQESFSSLVHSTFTETSFIEDVLPRGTRTGDILHKILEHTDFTTFVGMAPSQKEKLIVGYQTQLGYAYPHGEEKTRRYAERVFEIIHACAHAQLTLSGNTVVSLAKLSRSNLRREISFGSSARTHQILRERKQTPLRTSMHGVMDLIFTHDEKNYYILDYKSNSVSDISPEHLTDYIHEHYYKQAEIYTEALDTFLSKNYPNENRRVAGCFFMALRYLKAESTSGLVFLRTNHGK
ncbi:MAG: RecBCD enzyme subunit RecB [Turneriella sp.]|nr:RecBCD enzyme subunit RecB [Turneriella sp.]